MKKLLVLAAVAAMALGAKAEYTTYTLAATPEGTKAVYHMSGGKVEDLEDKLSEATSMMPQYVYEKR